MATQGQAGAVVLAAVALGLYSRRVPQKVWAAVWGGRGPTFGSAIPDTAQYLGGVTVDTTNLGNSNPPTTGGVAAPASIRAAEAAVTATRPMPQWVNWCLQWADDVRSRLGLHTWYGLKNATAACASQPLSGGPAPAGALICFRPTAQNPDAHVGISNGDGTYTSAGLAGGVQTLPYLSNPLYQGWAA